MPEPRHSTPLPLTANKHGLLAGEFRSHAEVAAGARADSGHNRAVYCAERAVPGVRTAKQVAAPASVPLGAGGGLGGVVWYEPIPLLL